MDRFSFASCVFSLFCCVRADIITFANGDHVEINCSDKKFIDIINITVSEHATECPRDSCIVDVKDKTEIQHQCNGYYSCNITSNLRTDCLNNYGYFNLNYTCEDVEILPCSCNFEQGLCCWSISSDSPYQWKKGTRNTGPTTDHITGSYGSYIYAVTSTESDGYTTSFVSELIQPNKKQCLTFWYFITKTDVGVLNVYQIPVPVEDHETQPVNIWTTSKRTRMKWYNQILRLPDNNHTYTIVFEAVQGDKEGFIALDDIVIANKDCYVSEHDCNFEKDSCTWSTNKNNNYHWTMHDGETDASDTGPDYDHSTGLKTGTYIYLEAGDFKKGTTADLTSSDIRQSHLSCLTFWYHMRDKDMGGLKVNLMHGNKTNELWSKSGHRENSWRPAFVSIPISGTFNIVFRGIRGKGIQSDIAIDDLYLFQQTCSDLKRSLSHLTNDTYGKHIHLKTCLNVERNVEIQDCTNNHIQFDQSELTFYPKYEECAILYENVKSDIEDRCSRTSIGFCALDFSYVLKTNQTCFMTNRLAVEYTCKALPVIRSEPQSQSYQGIAVAGGVLAGVILLTCAVVGLFFMLRRSKDVKSPIKPPKKLRQKNPALIAEYQNDYTGNQNIALNNSGGHVLHAAAVNNNDLQYEHVLEGKKGKSRTDEYECPYTDIDNTGEEGEQTPSVYEYLDSEQIRDSRRNDHEGAKVEYYACAKGNVQDTNNESHYSMAVEENSESNNIEDYAILDPNETGFNRSNTTINAPSRNDNTPTRNITNMNSEKEDLYDVSNNGTYDTSFNKRHKETDNKVYSHTVDSVYDMASHKRENREKEDAYDHFVSEKLEDDNGVLTDL